MTSSKTPYITRTQHPCHPFKVDISVVNWNCLHHQDITIQHWWHHSLFWQESPHMHLINWAEEVTQSRHAKADALLETPLYKGRNGSPRHSLSHTHTHTHTHIYIYIYIYYIYIYIYIYPIFKIYSIICMLLLHDIIITSKISIIF